jgi:hypothetical protein
MGSLERFLLAPIIEHYGARAFVETGTGEGKGVRYAQTHPFNEIYSVEILAQQVEKLKPTFGDDPRVHLHAGESAAFLAQILPRIKTNAVFWLDAHYPGANFNQATYDQVQDLDVRLPLERELQVIHDLRRGFSDVILIDDLRIYEKDNFGNGNLDDLGVASIAKYDSSFLYTIFKQTHDCKRFLEEEGYFVLFPKSTTAGQSTGGG